jgi:hypothetical protein
VLYQLSYTRRPHQNSITLAPLFNLVEGEGFEPSYSERTDLQSVAFNHSATPPNRTQDYADILSACQSSFAEIYTLHLFSNTKANNLFTNLLCFYLGEDGAGYRNRTDDLRITSALLYQLS